MFELHKYGLSKAMNVLADGGYTGDNFAYQLNKFYGAMLKLQSEMSFINS